LSESIYMQQTFQRAALEKDGATVCPTSCWGPAPDPSALLRRDVMYLVESQLIDAIDEIVYFSATQRYGFWGIAPALCELIYNHVRHQRSRKAPVSTFN
jgi:hypothetical protein